MTRQRKTMKAGGIWDSFNSAWNTTKKEATNAYNSAASSVSSTPAPAPAPAPTPVPAPAPTYTPVLGGRKRKSKRGGYSANTPTNGLASSAASFSGKTAQPHSMVGGKTRRRRRRSHTKSCKQRRCRKH